MTGEETSTREERKERLGKIFSAAAFVSEDARKPLDALFEEMENRIEELESDPHSSDDCNCESDDDDGGVAESVEEAIENLLISCDRPVGTHTFNIKSRAEFDRAMIGLYDAIGKTL